MKNLENYSINNVQQGQPSTETEKATFKSKLLNKSKVTNLIEK